MRGKRVLVTGATTGIGRVTALELGAPAPRSARRARPGQGRGDAGRAARGGRAAGVALLADLSLMSSVRALAAEVRGKFDRIDVLVNNAGAIFSSRALTAEGSSARSRSITSATFC